MHYTEYFSSLLRYRLYTAKVLKLNLREPTIHPNLLHLFLIEEVFNKPALSALSVLPLPEYGRTHAYHRGSLFDGNRVVTGHAHG